MEKRRRTYNDDHGDAKQAVLKNKRFLIGLCILVLLVVGALAGTYMYRLTSFNTEEFAGRSQSDLSAAWGGRWKLRHGDGRPFHEGRPHQGHFPAGFLPVFCNDGRRFRRNLRHVPVHGKNQGESLNMAKVTIGLRPGFSNLPCRRRNGNSRSSSGGTPLPRLEVGYAHKTEEFTLERNDGPFYMRAEAYIRTSGNGTEPEYVLDLSQQKLKIKGWPLMGVDSGSIILNGNGVKQLTFSGFHFLLGTDFRHQAWTLTGREF